MTNSIPSSDSPTALPEGWRVVQLENVATLQRGKDLPESERKDGPYPVIGSNGVVGFHSVYVSSGPGVLVGRSGSVGKVTWSTAPYWPLNTSLWVKDFHGNDPEFVFFLLSHMNLAQYTAGVSVPTLNRNVIHPLKVFLPLLTEQRAIASTLRAAQAAAQARRRAIELERERKAALMQVLFTKGTRGEATKTTEIGEVPESWEVVPLGQFISDGPQNGLYKPAELYGRGVHIIRINDFDNNGMFVNLDFKRVELQAKDLKLFRVKEGDILINRVNSLSHLGKCALVPELSERTVFESNMMRFRVNEREMSPEYLFFCLVTPGTRERIVAKARRAVAQSSINQGDVKSLLIPTPSLAEQREIAEVLRACDEVITGLEQEVVLHEELFRVLLEELMTGRVRVV